MKKEKCDWSAHSFDHFMNKNELDKYSRKEKLTIAKYNGKGIQFNVEENQKKKREEKTYQANASTKRNKTQRNKQTERKRKKS